MASFDPHGELTMHRMAYLLLMLTPSLVSAGTFTIGPGDSLVAAVRRLRPGDTLYLRGGIYAGPALKSDIPSGTDWDHPVTIAAAPGERPILRPERGYGAIWFYGAVSHHIIIDRLTLDGSRTGSDVVSFGNSASHDITLRHCEVTGGRNGGVGQRRVRRK